MRIALCLGGYVGTMEKFPDENKELLIDINEGYTSIKENIIQDYDVDTFIFSFDINRKDEILETYNPIRYQIEEQIKEFKIPHQKYKGSMWGMPLSTSVFAVQSQHYSRQKAIQLKAEYEKENNFKYDLVIMARMDMDYFTPFVFEDKNPEKLYIAGPSAPDRVNEFYLLSGSDVMDKVGDFYNDIENCGLVQTGHAHIALANYFKRCGLWESIEYYKWRPWGTPCWKPKDDSLCDMGMMRLKPNVKTILKGEVNEK